MKPIYAISLLSAGVLMATAGTLAAEQAGGWMEDAVSGCTIWSSDAPRPEEGLSWTGACHDGKASGRGVLVWWDEKGLVGRYTGEMKGGKLDGEGRLTLRDEETDGFNEFLGRFAESRPLGNGFLTTAKGERFLGELIDGIKHTKGIVKTAEGWLMKGEFKDGHPVGRLLVDYTTEDGERYFGQVENEARHGFGVLVASDKDFYAGEFANGFPQGPGIYKGTGGDRYTGDFAEGKPNGFGTSIDAVGNVIQGRFVDGEPDGQLLVTLPDGTQTVTTWKAGGKE